MFRSVAILPFTSSNSRALSFVPSGPTGVDPFSGWLPHELIEPPATTSRVSVTPMWRFSGEP